MHENQGAYKVSLSPYPGLRAFRKDESDIFFGRDDHVDLLIKKLANAHFVCVTGPSGCGKSSLVRTGLQNALEAGFLAGRGSDWIFCDFNPGDRPLEAMTGTVAKACGEFLPSPVGEDAPAAEDEVRHMLQHGIGDARRSNDLARVLAPLDLGGRPILLFVDQFEELFRYAQREPNAAVRFVEILLQTAAAKSNIYIVITIRTDELEKCSRYTGLTRVINESQFLTPTLDRYQIQEAIEGPIAIFGGKIDPKLTIWLLNSLDEELDKLPLMQHALKLLYAHKSGSERRPDVRLTIDDFVTVFGLDPHLDFSQSESRFALRETLARRLDAIYEDLPPHLKRAAARMFCALTAVDSGSRDIRRPLPMVMLARTIGEAVEDTKAIVDAFRSGDESYLILKGGEDGMVDVPHECILRLWPRLQNRWLANERRSADNIWLLASLAKNWSDSEKQSGLAAWLLAPALLKGFTLDHYRSWLEKYLPNADWAARYLSDFIWPSAPGESAANLSTDSVYRKVEQFFDASRTYRRRSRWTVSAAAAGAAACMALIAVVQIRSNETQRQTAYLSITQKITESKAGAHPVTNLDLAATAVREAQRVGDIATVNLAAGNLWETLATVHELSRAKNATDGDATGELFSAQLTPKKTALMTLDRGGLMRRWPFDGERIGRPSPIDGPRGPASQGRTMTISPRGDLAAAGYSDGSIQLFDLKAETPRARQLTVDGRRPHDSFVFDLQFSLDGTQLYSASHDGTVRSWARIGSDGADWTSKVLVDTRTIELPGKGRGVSLRVWSIDVSEELKAIALAADLGVVCVTKLGAIASPSCSQAGHDRRKSLKSVKFQPGRATLVSAGNDDRIAFWRLTSEASLVPTATRIFEDSDIWDLDFSADGRLLASASWDGNVRIYDPDDRRLIDTLPGHEQLLRTVRFDATARLLTTSSFDGTARIMTPFETRLGLLDLSYRFPPPPADTPGREIGSVALGGDGMWMAFHDRSQAFVKQAGEDMPRALSVPADAMTMLGTGEWLGQLVAHPTKPAFAASAVKPFVVIWSRQASSQWVARIVALPGKVSRPRPVALSADGTLFAVALNEPKRAAILLCPFADADLSTCAGSRPGSIRRITLQPRHDGRGPSWPTALAFSATGRLLAVGNGNGTLRVFDLGVSPPRELILAGHGDAVSSVAFAPDERSLLSASLDKSLRIWSLVGGGVQTLKGHKSIVTGAAFSATGRWIASASQDEKVIIWDARDGKPLARLPVERDSITSFDVRQTPRGTLMATGSAGGMTSVMRFFETAEDVLKDAEEFLTQNMGLAGERL